MKIVRLESKPNLTESQFTNDLSIPIQVKSNGEVALKSISFNLYDLKFTIPKNKYKLNFILETENDGITRENYVPAGQYKLFDFLSLLRKILNYQLPSNMTDDEDLGFGFEWNIEVSRENYRTTITFYRNELINITTDNIEIENSYNSTDNRIPSIVYEEPYFYKSEDVISEPDNYNGGLQSINEINRGAWRISCSLSDRSVFSDIKNSNWVFGIGGSLDEDNYDSLASALYVGIGCKDTNYVIKKNGVFVPAIKDSITYSPLPDDIISIYKTYDDITKITQVIYELQRGTESIIFEGDVITLSSIVSLISSANPGSGAHLVLKIEDDFGKIQFTNINMSPTGTKELLNGQYIRTVDTQTIYNSSVSAVQPSTVILSMLSEAGNPYEFAQLLGFGNVSEYEKAITGTFKSGSIIDYNIFYSDLIIEIDELNLDGYDHGVKMSRNIVMTITPADLKQAITQLSYDSLRVSYTEPATFLFVGMNNGENNKALSNLTIRASVGGKLININGDMTSTLLIRDDRDKKVMI